MQMVYQTHTQKLTFVMNIILLSQFGAQVHILMEAQL